MNTESGLDIFTSTGNKSGSWENIYGSIRLGVYRKGKDVL